jgi:hypothetical protein
MNRNLIYFVSMTRVTVTNDKCRTFQERVVAPRDNTYLLFLDINFKKEKL